MNLYYRKIRGYFITQLKIQIGMLYKGVTQR